MRHHYLVAYDIASAERFRRVHRLVRDFGDPLQLSLFWCQLTALERRELERRLRELVVLDEDSLVFTPVSPANAKTELPAPPKTQILGTSRLPNPVGGPRIL